MAGENGHEVASFCSRIRGYMVLQNGLSLGRFAVIGITVPSAPPQWIANCQKNAFNWRSYFKLKGRFFLPKIARKVNPFLCIAAFNQWEEKEGKLRPNTDWRK